MSASAITKDVYPFVFGLRFGLHAVNTLKNHGFGRMGKGLQTSSWVQIIISQKKDSEFHSILSSPHDLKRSIRHS
jgi:hypothetical protein